MKATRKRTVRRSDQRYRVDPSKQSGVCELSLEACERIRVELDSDGELEAATDQGWLDMEILSTVEWLIEEGAGVSPEERIQRQLAQRATKARMIQNRRARQMKHAEHLGSESTDQDETGDLGVSGQLASVLRERWDEREGG